ncbi:hypothetical protein HDV05_002010 [Chytridiales sp. JEL 0842]|nr:hypothetical protein HDV05_002010 [Chytridiales sp. JEL 0842]
MTISCLVMVLCSGTVYVFSLFGPQLASKFSYTGAQTALIGMSGNTGVYISGPFWGRMVDNGWRRVVFGAGAGLVGVGYGLASLAYVGSLGPAIPYPILSLFFLIVGFGCGASYHASLATNLRNFPNESRGLAIGLPVSAFGLSAFAYAVLAGVLFRGSGHGLKEIPDGTDMGGQVEQQANNTLDVAAFLAFLGIVGFGINILAMFLLTDLSKLKAKAMAEECRQQQQQYHEVGQESWVASRAEPLIVSTSRPAVDDAAEIEDLGPATERSPLLSVDLERAANLGTETLPNGVIVSSPSPGTPTMYISSLTITDEPRNHNLTRPTSDEDVHDSCFTSPDAYLLVVIVVAVAGTGLMYVNNVGTILLALFPPHTNPTTDPILQAQQALHVTTLSVASFFGRFLTGALADRFSTSSSVKSKFYISRSFWAFSSPGLMLIASLLGTQTKNLDHLFVVSIVVGVGYGGLFVVIPMLINEYFGSKKFGVHWGWMSVTPAFAGQLSSFIFGTLYDLHAKRQPLEPNPIGQEPESSLGNLLRRAGGVTAPARECKGSECFQDTFVVTAGMCIVGLVAAGCVWYRRLRMAKDLEGYNRLT